MENYKLFLDDVRNPFECTSYMYKRIGRDNLLYVCDDWIVVRNYDAFVLHITTYGMPEIISFDHDLANEHYDPVMFDYPEKYECLYGTFAEKTGYDAAKWLVDYCRQFRVSPKKVFIHSMNPVGVVNIENCLRELTKK